MPRTSRLTLKQKISQLDAKKKALQARLGKEERARDTRRKVLLGALLLHRMEADAKQGERLRAWVAREMPSFLTREADQELFQDFYASTSSGTPSEEQHEGFPTTVVS